VESERGGLEENHNGGRALPKTGMVKQGEKLEHIYSNKDPKENLGVPNLGLFLKEVKCLSSLKSKRRGRNRDGKDCYGEAKEGKQGWKGLFRQGGASPLRARSFAVPSTVGGPKAGR